MNKYRSPFDLLPGQLGHELHMSDTLGQLVGLTRAIRNKCLELAESNAWRTANENQRLLLVDVLLGLSSMLGDVEIPSRGEVHGVTRLDAELSGLLADPRRGENLTQVYRA